MASSVITVEHLSKRYLIGHQRNRQDGIRHVLESAIRAPLKFIRTRRDQRRSAREEFWALKDVSFTVGQGEVVGILGLNGAGKSTLLKVLSRITEPTTGRIYLKGRVASLLEVGTGFHPELTGRENIYLNGAILGMTRADIRRRFDQIVEFAEIDKFLDTPVKRYSSGMYVRLAFSVAAHLEPDILVVDEVLAVGDVAFQKKCLGKMAEARNDARTVLFVSHNLAAVESFCSRGIVLRQGKIAFDGPCRKAIDFYLESMDNSALASYSDTIDLASSPTRTAKYRPQLKKLQLLDGEGKPLRGRLSAGDPLAAVITVDLESPSAKVDVELAFFTPSGQRVCTAHSAYEPNRPPEGRSRHKVFVCHIDSLPLIPGEYRLRVALDIALCESDCVENATRLTVVKADYYGTGIAPILGMFMVNNRWTFDGDETTVGKAGCELPNAPLAETQ
jgi:lipopolysaccharide transport system ATP-binding protein